MDPENQNSKERDGKDHCDGDEHAGLCDSQHVADIAAVRQALSVVCTEKDADILLQMGLGRMPPPLPRALFHHFLSDVSAFSTVEKGLKNVRTALGNLRNYGKAFGQLHVFSSRPAGHRRLVWAPMHLHALRDGLAVDEYDRLREELLHALLVHPFWERSFMTGDDISEGEFMMSSTSFLLHVLLLSLTRLEKDDGDVEQLLRECIGSLAYRLREYQKESGVQAVGRVQNQLIDVVRFVEVTRTEVVPLLNQTNWSQYAKKGEHLYHQLTNSKQSPDDAPQAPSEVLPDETHDPVAEANERNAQLETVAQLTTALKPHTHDQRTAWETPITYVLKQAASVDVVTIRPYVVMALDSNAPLPNTLQWQCDLAEALGTDGKIHHWGLSETYFLSIIAPLENWLCDHGEDTSELRLQIVRYLQSDGRWELRTELGIPPEVPQPVTCVLNHLRGLLEARLESESTIDILDPESELILGSVTFKHFLGKEGSKFIFGSTQTSNAVADAELRGFTLWQLPTVANYRSDESIDCESAFGHAGFSIEKQLPLGRLETSGMVVRPNPRFDAMLTEIPEPHRNALLGELKSGRYNSPPIQLVVVTDESHSRPAHVGEDPAASDSVRSPQLVSV